MVPWPLKVFRVISWPVLVLGALAMLFEFSRDLFFCLRVHANFRSESATFISGLGVAVLIVGTVLIAREMVLSLPARIAALLMAVGMMFLSLSLATNEDGAGYMKREYDRQSLIEEIKTLSKDQKTVEEKMRVDRLWDKYLELSKKKEEQEIRGIGSYPSYLWFTILGVIPGTAIFCLWIAITTPPNVPWLLPRKSNL
jgi:hypothetical protein